MNDKINDGTNCPIRILVTNSKAPTFLGVLYSLKQGLDCTVIATSKIFDEVSSSLADEYVCLDSESSVDHVVQVLKICTEKKIKVIIPLSIDERILLLKEKNKFDEINVKILSSSIESIEKGENKVLLFELSKENGLPTPEFYVVDNWDELKENVFKLGYPNKKVVVKPVNSCGSRGMRILNKRAEYKKLFYKERADYTEITMTDLKNIIGKKFLPLILCEHLPGEEYTVDCLRMDNHNYAFPRVRVKVKEGLTSVGEMREDKEIIKYSKQLAELLNLTTVFGFQFKFNSEGVPVIIDCNPRIQGTMVMSTLANVNIIAEGVRLLLGQKHIPLVPEWGMRYHRFYSGLSVGKEKKIINF